MPVSPIQLKLARRIAYEVPDIDQKFPRWAKRSNPIVRRQLGPHWRVFPPELAPIATWLTINTVIILATIQFPLLFLGIMIALMLAAVAFVPILLLYGRTLIDIMRDATHSMAQEYENDTINVLRTTPYSAHEIVLSKVAASIWRRMDELVDLIAYTLTLGVSIIVTLQLNLYSPEEMPYVAQIMSLILMVISVVRLPLEMFMVASIGVMLGSTVRSRHSAFMSGLVLLFFYFLLLNFMRFIPMGWPARLFVEGVLPIGLAIAVSYGCIMFTTKTLRDDS
jgi:hypothetical protein